MITLVDYKIGNLLSIANMIKKIGEQCIISHNIDDINDADKLILPGVGAFDHGMENLKNCNLIDVLTDKVIEKKTPILGICLGMQLMTISSEEGNKKGLGWIQANTIKFEFNDLHEKLNIPHMGWNTLIIKRNSKLFENLSEASRFYYVHSYYVKCDNENDELTTTNYGINFCSSFNNKNIFGVQFHPEKSHKFGMQIFKNFISL